MSNGWEHPSGELELSADYIDIWRANLKLPFMEAAQFQGLLSREEQDRAARYKSDKRHKQFIVSRGLLRMLIGRYLDINPAGFDFSYTSHQKPFLPVAALGVPITFNITHSHNMILVALSLNRNIGIDAEYIRHNVEFRKLGKRFFSRQESVALEAYGNSDLPAAFFACWTRKEAFVKAIGDGIAFGLGDFSVSVDPYDNMVGLQIEPEMSGSDVWSIMNLEAGGDYAAAVAASGGKFKLRLWTAEV